MKKAIHMEDILLTPNHGSVVGTLVYEDTENRHLPSSRLNQAKSSVNGGWGVNCAKGIVT